MYSSTFKTGLTSSVALSSRWWSLGTKIARAACFSTSSSHHGPFRLAVIGSGPAGFYTAIRVMRRLPDACVDMYEQLPVPFGLVRFGVAPDHPEVKNCEAAFTELASSKKFNFFGNVAIGTSLPLAALYENYDAVLFAYGASKDRVLGIPGEDFRGIHSARAFVGWYNGLPEFSSLNPDLESSDTAVIIGQGNVALDVARILLSPIELLRRTDICEEALETLSKSRIRYVHVVGRRGPIQAAFTIKEVRELIQLPEVRLEPINPKLLPPESNALPRPQKRLARLLSEHSSCSSDLGGSRTVSLDFLLSPLEFRSDSSLSAKLTSIDFVYNTWATGSDPFQKSSQVTATEDRVQMAAGLAFRSIGYKAEPLSGMDELGIDFNHQAGQITNDQGRVLAHGKVAQGLYCAGWAKSGPTGVIATTMQDSFATAELIAQDWDGHASSKKGSVAISPTLSNPVDWFGWQRIDLAERSRGKQLGKMREKFRSVQDMLDAA